MMGLVMLVMLMCYFSLVSSVCVYLLDWFEVKDGLSRFVSSRVCSSVYLGICMFI